MRVLAGDIGGTKTLLAIVDVDDVSARIHAEHRYDSHAYPGLAPMIREFLAQNPGIRCERAGFGIAGPVIDNRSEATNLPWIIDGGSLMTDLSLGPTRLVNDFVAVAYGISRLGDADLAVVNPGIRDPYGPIAIVGAGTGLGEGFMVWTGDRYAVVPSEGGHCDYAPRNELEIGLLRYLLREYAHVSMERVVSGLGLRNIYAYLREAGVAPESAAIRAAVEAGEDLGALIGTHALAGTDALCTATLALFVSAYGAEAGNVALKVVARGGVFIAGGIATKILPALTNGAFRAAYVDKGRLSNLVSSIPAFVITHPRVGLIGAAVAAL